VEIDFGGCRCQGVALSGDAGKPIRPARCRRCTSRFQASRDEATAGDTASSSQFGGGTPERAATMAA